MQYSTVIKIAYCNIPSYQLVLTLKGNGGGA